MDKQNNIALIKEAQSETTSGDWRSLAEGIAQNLKTPENTLKQLAQDGNRIVRATAKESLQKRHQTNNINK